MEQLRIIKTLAQLKELEQYIEQFEYIAYDTETTGTDKESKIIGISVCAEEGVGYYVITKYWDVVTSSLIDFISDEHIIPLIQVLKTKQLIMHNGVFDCAMTYNNYRIELINSLHTDTLALAHLLDENRSNGLKELGAAFFGESAKNEQAEMKASVTKNGGMLTKDKYELYKADAELIAKYGAKDAILTLKLFYILVEELFKQELDKFFYDEETMPLLRGPTYELNTTGLMVDSKKLQELRGALEAECLEQKAFIYKEITPHVKDKYPGTSKANTFNLNSSKQLAWLLFDKLGNDFNNLTEAGREVCHFLNIKVPYAPKDKRDFIAAVRENKERVYAEPQWNWKTKKMSNPKKINDYWHYFQCGKESLQKLAGKYKFVDTYLKYSKNQKLLKTYVIGIQDRQKYNIIHPSFLQNGTTSGRYSCKNPNFQNLPRDDKRIKSCIIARPGKVFVGADYSQLEPRVFASVSKDETLLDCFRKGQDFYSVVGMPIFEKMHLSAYKKDKNSFAEVHPELRNVAKAFALATPYGTSAFQQAQKLGRSREECQQIIDRYFDAYPRVELMMLESHEEAKKNGYVKSLYGRPRRIPEAKEIPKVYGNEEHAKLPYEARTLLNLAMNHRVQSSAASIMNRAAIAVHKKKSLLCQDNPKWDSVRIVLQVHDELILEGPEELTEAMIVLLKDSMEKTTQLPGVDLVAEPKAAYTLADLK